MTQKLKQYAPGLIILIISIIVGFSTYQDYGISWDEPQQRLIGRINHDYMFRGDTASFNNFLDKDYGVGFELPLNVIERNLPQPGSDRNTHLMRHVLSNLYFLLCAFAGYVLFFRLFKKQSVAIVGYLMLLLSPRIWAHSFFNTKDMPFLGTMILVFLAVHMAFQKRSYLWFLLLGFISGYALSIRILGIVPIGLITFFLVVDIISAVKTKGDVRRQVGFLFSFWAVMLATAMAFWPILWGNPFANFINVYKAFSHFRWQSYLMFDGKLTYSLELPWNYLPYWMWISIPELWVLLGIAGFIAIAVKGITNPLKFITDTPERNFTLYIVVLVVPIASVIFMKAVVYDDWRHVYFVYPSLVLLGLWVLNKLVETKAKNIVLFVCGVQVVVTSVTMVRLHPFEQVYFNRFVSHEPEYLRKNFDYEYWGPSYMNALEYLLEHDTSSHIRVFQSISPTYHAYMMLQPHQQERIHLVDRDSIPYYFITTFRQHPDDYPEYKEIVHEIKVQNSTLLRIYKVDTVAPKQTLP
jgi:hypothetical protein